jgi:putative component of membrane protein insertase Oxa1/YidC/SpoIIIJ protein YidD
LEIAVSGSIARKAALAAVITYRRLLSPLKGFRCAHAALHGVGSSCSDVALHAFATLPLGAAVAAVSEQLGKCRHARHIIDVARIEGHQTLGLDPATMSVLADLLDHNVEYCGCGNSALRS